MDDISMCGWCSRYTYWLQVNYWNPVWTFITTSWASCSAAPCIWWYLCANRWFCWLILIIITILTAVLYAVLVVTIGLICIACYIVCAFACALPNLVGEGKGCLQLCSGPNVQGGAGGASGSSGSGLLNDPGTGPGTGIGTRTAGSGSSSATTAPTAQRLASAPGGACGCREGQIGAIVALLVFAALHSSGAFSDVATSVARSFGVGTAFVLAGALVGKSFGLLRAYSGRNPTPIEGPA